jgi:CBS domain-containing protein
MTENLAESAPAVSAGLLGRTTVRQMMKPTTTIEQGAHVAAAAYLIKHFHDVGLVVLGAGSDEPVATITDTEIVKAIADGRDLEEARISEIVAENPVAVDADARADDAARLMLSQGLDSLPVMQGRRIIGIVQLADLRGVSQGSGPVTAAKATL